VIKATRNSVRDISVLSQKGAAFIYGERNPMELRNLLANLLKQ